MDKGEILDVNVLFPADNIAQRERFVCLENPMIIRDSTGTFSQAFPSIVTSASIRSETLHGISQVFIGGRRVIGISGSLISSKTQTELIFNPCGEFR